MPKLFPALPVFGLLVNCQTLPLFLPKEARISLEAFDECNTYSAQPGGRSDSSDLDAFRCVALI